MAEPKTLPGPHRNSVSTSYTASAGGTGENERKNQFPHPHSESEETLGVVLSHHLPATLGLGLGTDGTGLEKETTAEIKLTLPQL